MKPQLSQRFQFSLVYILVAVVVLTLLQSWLLAPRTVELPLSAFLELLRAGKVERVALTEREIRDLPTMSNMPVMLARFAPGVAARPVVEMAGQGAVDVPSETAAPLGAVGGNEWSIDGATNNGSDRDFATSPNTDMIQEMRIESTSFSASVGHGTGVGIAMMTRPGTNAWRGTGNFQYWTNQFNPPTTFQKEAFDVNRSTDRIRAGLFPQLQRDDRRTHSKEQALRLHELFVQQ
jgi:hypothetical protein